MDNVAQYNDHMMFKCEESNNIWNQQHCKHKYMYHTREEIPKLHEHSQTSVVRQDIVETSTFKNDTFGHISWFPYPWK